MTEYHLVYQPTGKVVALVHRAEGWWAKGCGVLGKRALASGQGLWLPGVASVHTVFVRFPLDLLFLDARFQAVKIAPRTPPGRWLVRARAACHTVELGAGTLAAFMQKGDLWTLEPAPPHDGEWNVLPAARVL